MNKTKFFSSLLVAALFASTSVFTSCKDYDDDIKNLQEQINARAMQTELESLKSSLQNELATVNQSLTTKTAALNQAIELINSELAKKASAADLNALTTKVNAQGESIAQLLASIDALTAKDAALQTQIDAINTALNDYAKKKDLDELAAKYTALKGDFDAAVAELKAKIATEKSDREAADAALQAEFNTAINGVNENLKLQEKALNDYKAEMAAKLAELEAQLKTIIDNGDAASIAESFKKINDEIAKINSTIETKVDELNKKINAVDAKLADYAKTADVNASMATMKKELKDEMTQLSEQVNNVQAQVNILSAFIDKQLTSLVLWPDFYWEGLEAIESPALFANIFDVIDVPYTFSYTVTGGTQGSQDLIVTVPKTMGFKATDGKIYGSESAYTWDKNRYPTGWYYYLDRTTGATVYADGGSLTYQDGADIISYLGADPSTRPATETLNQGAIAYYHYSPSTADLKGYKIDFFGNLAAHYTRGGYNSLIGATPWDNDMSGEMNAYVNGRAAVPFDVNWNVVMSLYANWAYNNNTAESDGDGYVHQSPDWDDNVYYNGGYAYGTSFDDESGKNEAYLPFIAMQLQKGDTIVTSDYAVVVPAELNIIALADNKPEQIIGGRATAFSGDHIVANTQTTTNAFEYYGVVRANHLYESVGYDNCSDTDGYGAIPMPATHSVQFDGSIDLKPFIETHYDYKSYAKYGQSTLDKVMDELTMNMLGLHYEFNVVDYYLGQEKTSESAHIEQIAPGVFAPRSVTEDGATIKGKTATREVIDREPLIRVDLVDANDNIVRYGYIKLRIVETEQAKEDMEVEFTFNDIYMNCGDSVRLTWSQMENKILAQLGTNGLTKQEFEQYYYLENVGGNEYMPHITPAAGENAGGLYGDAEANQFMATRYAKNSDGKYVKVDGGDDLTNLANYTNTANWFGRVWYTPHDNATTGQNWDSQTNVLIWNICEGQAGNMTRAAFEQMIKAVEASYTSKGKSTKELSTVVRFVNKLTGASIWVTLKFDIEKIHFAYADINHRVLDHWYDYHQGYLDGTADTIEVYANVPTPQETGRTPLGINDFKKDLTEYWLEKKVIPMVYDKAHFNKFTANNNISISFQFRLPKKDENTVDLTAKNDGTWVVYGISGTKYTLYLSADKSTIWAKKTTGMSADEKIAYVEPTTGMITYYGRGDVDMFSKGIVAPYTATADQADKVNGAATDILNLIGMYDAAGNKQKDVYLTGHDKKTFAAYVEIKVSSAACYDPLMGKNFFNVRFLRPINVWAGNTEKTDALNATEFINIWELLYIRDWRTYAVVPEGATQQFGAAAIDGTGFDGKKHKGDFAEGNVTYEYYGISNLYVRRNEIKSDAYLEPSKRVALDPVKDVAKIKALYSIDKIPALTNGELEYLKIIAKGDADASTYTVAGTAKKVASTQFDDVIAYSNNGGVVNKFHIYVPIAVEYPWGGLRTYTQTVWAVITVNPTVQ